MFVFGQKLMLFKAKCEGYASVFDLKNEGKQPTVLREKKGLA